MNTVDGILPGPADSTLGSSPAQKAIGKFLSVHEALPPRSRVARIFGREPLSVEGAHWFLGAIGELQVESTLTRLGKGWRVLHSLAANGEQSNPERAPIEHLVIGPAGLFAVKIGNHPGHSVWASGRTFLVAGHQVPHIRTAEFQMGHIERTMSARMGSECGVSAIIVVVNPRSLSIADLPRDVYVVPSRHLSRWFEAQEHVFDSDQLHRMSTLASEAFGQAPMAAVTDIARERARFEQVRGEVARARILRRLWVLSAAVIVLGGLALAGVSQLAGATGQSG